MPGGEGSVTVYDSDLISGFHTRQHLPNQLLDFTPGYGFVNLLVYARHFIRVGGRKTVNGSPYMLKTRYDWRIEPANASARG